MYHMLQNVLSPLGSWHFHRNVRLSRNEVRQYCESVSRTSLANDLDGAFTSLVGNHEHPKRLFHAYATSEESGLHKWGFDNFSRWIIEDNAHQPLREFTPMLWRSFVYFSGYPFADPALSEGQYAALPDERIDESGFIRAYILLGLGGAGLLGGSKEDWSHAAGPGATWSQESARLTALMYDSLKVPAAKIHEAFRGAIDPESTLRAEKHVKDALRLGQPTPFDDVSFDAELAQASRRLLTDTGNVEPKGSDAFALSKADLKAWVQIILLLRVRSVSQRRASTVHGQWQTNGEVEGFSYVTDPREIRLSEELADAFVQLTIGGTEFVGWQTFERLCSQHVRLRFLTLGLLH